MHSNYRTKPKKCHFCKENFGNDDWQVTFLAACDHVVHVNCLCDGGLCPTCEMNLYQRVKDDFRSVIASMRSFLEGFGARINPLIELEGLGQGERQQLKYLKLKMAELKSTIETYDSKADLCKWCEGMSQNLCKELKHLLSKRTELQSYIVEITSTLVQLTSVIRALGSVAAA